MEDRVLMKNVRIKFSTCRKSCPGMREEVYKITEYMSEKVHDIMDVNEMLLLLIETQISLTQENLEKMSNYFIENKKLLLRASYYFVQIIDMIAEKEFSENFRKIAKLYGINPPRIGQKYEKKYDREYSDFITVSVDWWAASLINPIWEGIYETSEYGILVKMINRGGKAISLINWRIFKNTLAMSIFDYLQTNEECEFGTEYAPYGILENAALKAKVDLLTGGLPWETTMRITKSKEVIINNLIGEKAIYC